MLLTFFFSAFNIAIILTLNYLSVSSKICVISESGSVDYFVSWQCGGWGRGELPFCMPPEHLEKVIVCMPGNQHAFFFCYGFREGI